ncbi:MAG: UDP-N-acetylmuramoyl-tripeptide--D-alanyl-D-alanine ligase, partial [Ignavibacteria bacterium]|nr:UDP-N-acetylmuramoyl-tripeptide--D-alanyl-D-alanine ligase [Ignavibacteria bacterium]
MKISLSDIQKIPNVELINKELFTRLKGVSIDSRTVKPNDLFFAIKGENHDGHSFIDNAIKSQAKGIVIAKSRIQEFKDKKIFIVAVNDTTLALGKFSNIVRKKFQGKIIGITGSNGKTTTKEMIYEVLASKYRVLKSEGNLNNHIGVPLTLFRLNNHYDFAVVEMGINHFGEMEYLTEIVEPDYGCITNVGNAHIEFFKSIEGVAKAKRELFKYLLAHDKKAIVNIDDKYVRKNALKIKKKLTYVFKDDPDVKGEVLCLNNKAQPVLKFGYRGHFATAFLNTFGLA